MDWHSIPSVEDSPEKLVDYPAPPRSPVCKHAAVGANNITRDTNVHPYRRRTKAPVISTITAIEEQGAVGVAPQHGQIKALRCLFYMATSQAGRRVLIIWNERAVQIFAGDGEHIATYPRPETTGLYYRTRTSTGSLIKGAGNNPSAGSTGTATRTVSMGTYIGILANKFYGGYKR